MSGIYKPLIIGLGVVSVVLCIWIVHKLRILEAQPVFGSIEPFSLIAYLFWLTKEIGKADWAVTKVILSPDIPDDQRLIAVPTRQKTDFGRMIFANSITITPGTITVETEEDRFIVHALNKAAADQESLGDMNDRVAATEWKARAGGEL